MNDYSPWTPPFKYDEFGNWITDSREHRILDMRGWGFLTGGGHGALGMHEDDASAVQDRIGKRVCELLNKDAQAK